MGVRSEYQKHFKVSALRKSLPNYYENVAFRTARREREYAHTPLSWCDEDDADSVDTDSVEDNQSDHPQIKDAVVKSSGEKPVESASSDALLKDSLSKDGSEKGCQFDDDCPPQYLEEKEQPTTPPKQLVEKDDPSHLKLCEENSRPTKKSLKGTVGSKTFVVKPGKQRRPDRKQKIAPRPKQVKSSPRSSRPATVEHPAPFMSYGWGDVERDLCQHKTFNVRATADVYPAALRAQTRRKTASESRAQSAKKTVEDRVKAMLEAAAKERALQGIDWQSEYQQRYPAYDQSEYMRSISARANDRKLCRVVYVS